MQSPHVIVIFADDDNIIDVIGPFGTLQKAGEAARKLPAETIWEIHKVSFPKE